MVMKLCQKVGVGSILVIIVGNHHQLCCSQYRAQLLCCFLLWLRGGLLSCGCCLRCWCSFLSSCCRGSFRGILFNVIGFSYVGVKFQIRVVTSLVTIV